MKKENDQMSAVREIIERYDGRESNLIAILQDVQNEYKYLSEEALRLIAEELGLSTSARAPPAMCARASPSMRPCGKIWH